MVSADPKLGCGDLLYVGMHALPHFGAAMVHLNCSILVNQREGAGLVQMGNSKADAELHRSDCQAAFLTRIVFVPFGNFFPSPDIGTGFFQFTPYGLNTIVFERLAIMGGVGFSFATIEVSFSHYLGRKAEPTGDSIEYLLYHEHSLRPAKSTRSEEHTSELQSRVDISYAVFC